MKIKPLLCIVALLVAFFCILRVAAGWVSGEETMLKSLQSSALTTHTAIAANPEESNTPKSIPAPDLKVASVSPTTTMSQTSAEVSQNASPCPNTELSAFSVNPYRPREEIRLADPSNYGERFRTDVYGRPATNEYIVVLHETVYSADSALNYFRTPHTKDDDQASYHTLIKRDGTVVYVVPPEKRAFGAGNSIFIGPNGPESIKTKRDLPPSVNNFAYHVSLESPADGSNENRFHSGYTEAQYQSVAWLLAKTSIPDYRITTHRQVDRSGTRMDPRSFDQNKFFALLRSYPRQVRAAGVERCINPTVAQEKPATPALE